MEVLEDSYDAIRLMPRRLDAARDQTPRPWNILIGNPVNFGDQNARIFHNLAVVRAACASSGDGSDCLTASA